MALGAALLASAVSDYNVWVDVLAERRTIQVLHLSSEGTENLPPELTADMRIVTDGAANLHLRNSRTWCTVRLRWADGSGAGAVRGPTRMNIRDLLLSEGICEGPRHDHESGVTFQTEACLPLRLETGAGGASAGGGRAVRPREPIRRRRITSRSCIGTSDDADRRPAGGRHWHVSAGP